jgi:hypothetical protein
LRLRVELEAEHLSSAEFKEVTAACNDIDPGNLLFGMPGLRRSTNR